MDQHPPTLLICTVGGSFEPLVQTLSHWRPARAVFVPSEQTKAQIDTILREYSERTGQPLSPGSYERFPVSDPESLDDCLGVMQRLDEEVRRWLERGDDYRVIADFTAGTKCMTAALALQARRWPCLFSYVGGGQRTKEGVGIVISGTERIVHQANPWDVLGHQAVEDFVVLFDQRAFSAAANVAGVAKSRVSHQARKRELAALEQLASAFDHWDRFDHRASLNELTAVEKAANDLKEVFGRERAARLLDGVRRFTDHLAALCGAVPPSRHHVLDLLANAKRRREEGRTDDAVARLYRAIEAVAQVALKERHGLDNTGKVPIDRIPHPLRQAWESRAIDGVITIALQDAFTLLAELGDPLGKKFRDEKLDGKESPLMARNQSILAHGFASVSVAIYNKLWRAALSLADVDEGTLPRFPKLAEQAER